jgi:hypothetical protein
VGEEKKSRRRLEPAGEWAEHSAVQRQERHVPHYRATESETPHEVLHTTDWPVSY